MHIVIFCLEKQEWSYKKEKLRMWPYICVVSGCSSFVFGCSCNWQQDKYHIKKITAFAFFFSSSEIKSLLCCSFSVLPCHLRLHGMKEKKKKSVCLCASRNAIHTKRRPKCEFPAFCEGVHVAASNGRQHCLKKIMFFFPMVFIVKRQWTILTEAQKMCSERDQWLDLPRQSSFLLPFSIFSIVAHRRSFKWHLTLLLAADMVYSC